MPLLKIDNIQVEMPEGSTILEAARKLGIDIPYMCFLEGYEHFTSCMICVVEEKVSNRLLPSCSAPVSEGMVVETKSPEVINARRNALELLLKEHIGDCEGPCRLACPAHIDIPVFLRLLEAGKIEDAALELKKSIPFPAVLGRICPAPCEKACRRGQHDKPVSIKSLERFTGDRYISGQDLKLKARRPGSDNAPAGEKVAVIGSGPAGLSAAFYLNQSGHSCTVFEKRDFPGGMLRYKVGEEKLPHRVLEAETDSIVSLGVLLQLSTEIGVDVSMNELNSSFDAVVIAAGEIDRNNPVPFGVDLSDNGICINPSSFETDKKGVFACGGAVRPVRMAVKSVFEGRSAAYSVDRFITGNRPAGLTKTFNSIIGRLKEGEIREFLKDASDSPGTTVSTDTVSEPTSEDAVNEAGRCLRCDCGKSKTCELRKYAEQYKADRRRYRSKERKNFMRVTGHAEIIYEPGKCIKCGRCVKITEAAGERLGLSFIGRGFDTVIGVPFNKSLSKGLEKTQKLCVEKCPTGALYFKRHPFRD